MAFGDLATKEYLNPNLVDIMTLLRPPNLSLTEGVWDCWINHYGGYYWSDLVSWEIAPFYEALGWDEDAYNSVNASDYPESVGKSWTELTSEEQQAAANLCYIEETWNEEPFSTGWLTTSEYLANAEPFEEYVYNPAGPAASPSVNVAPTVTASPKDQDWT